VSVGSGSSSSASTLINRLFSSIHHIPSHHIRSHHIPSHQLELATYHLSFTSSLTQSAHHLPSPCTYIPSYIHITYYIKCLAEHLWSFNHSFSCITTHIINLYYYYFNISDQSISTTCSHLLIRTEQYTLRTKYLQCLSSPSST
jgi:hypothetical protein